MIDLVAVDDAVLEDLVQAATTDASADEVTPPLTPGPAWTQPRIAWLRTYHRDRRAGLGGPCAEATWAVVTAEQVIGSVRLKRTGQQGVLETGAWLTRSARGRGQGAEVLAAVLKMALESGARAVQAETTAANTSALALLRRFGFALTADQHGPGVRAALWLGDT